ncbi:MAG: GspE/PulE family protein, partial [Armatimonadota bacterium]
MNRHNDQQLAEALVRIGAITEVELQQAEDMKQQQDINLVQALLSSGMVSAHDIAQATEAMSSPDEPEEVAEPASQEAAYETTQETVEEERERKGARKRRSRPKRDSLESYEVNPAALQDIPRSLAEEYLLLPLQISQDRILVAMADATDVFAMDEVRSRTGKRVEPVEIDAEELKPAIEQYYSTQARQKVKVADTRDLDANLGEIAGEGLDDSLAEMLDTAPVVRIVQEVLNDAVRARASDIHIEPRGEHMTVRYRIDGQLQTATQLPMDMHRYVLSRIKILAGEDIAETRKPQDGRFATVVDDRPIDLRVSTLPTYWGEKAV